MFFVEAVDRGRVPLGDEVPAQVFPYAAAILALHKGIIVAMPCPRLGLLDEELVQEFGHNLVDVFRAIVRVKPENPEWELTKGAFEDWQEEIFGDLFASG